MCKQLQSLFALIVLSIVSNAFKFEIVHPFPKHYIAFRAKKPIIIDGLLNDTDWESVNWTPLFEDIQGPELPKPRFDTRAKMLWDDNYLYIGAWLEEPHIVATLQEKNSVINQDNDFEVFIDPSGDNHLYTEYEMNAFNTIWSLVKVNPYTSGYNVINPYPISVKNAVWLDGTINNSNDIDKGWSVEIAFSWTSLRQFGNRKTPPKNADKWRINFSRVEWQYEIINGKYVKKPDTPADKWVWTPQYAKNMYIPEVWGYIQFCAESYRNFSRLFDPDYGVAAVKQILYQIWQLQRSYYKISNLYAMTFAELNITKESLSSFPNITLNTLTIDSYKGYDASLIYNAQVWHVSDNQRTWMTDQCPLAIGNSFFYILFVASWCITGIAFMIASASVGTTFVMIYNYYSKVQAYNKLT